jgi:cysteine desulfurase
MAMDLEGLAVSGGAACHTGAASGSHVIAALYGGDDPYATVRFSLGAGTTPEHVAHAARITPTVVERLRALEGGA